MKKKLLGLFIALMMAVPAFASIAVSPTRIELNANATKANYLTTSIEVHGDPVKVMRFRVYPEYFKVSEASEVIMIEESNDPQNIAKKVRFVPSEFTVQPGKSQRLRVNIANTKGLVDGESRAILYMEDINPKEFNIPTGQAGIGAQLIVKTRVGVPIYIDKGKVSKIGEIEHLNIVKEKDGQYIDMKVLSKGNSRIRYSTQIQFINGKKVAKEYYTIERVAAPGNFNVIKEKLDTKGLTSGEYTLRATISYFDENGKKRNIKKETQVNIQGEM